VSGLEEAEPHPSSSGTDSGCAAAPASHGGYWDSLTPPQVIRLIDSFDDWRANPAIVDARLLDLLSRKDAVERRFQADKLTALLRALPTIRRMLEAAS